MFFVVTLINEGVADIAPNLIVKTGAADYGRPRLLKRFNAHQVKFDAQRERGGHWVLNRT